MQTLYSQLGKHFDAIANTSLADTHKEIVFLKTIFSQNNVRSVLDIACGTGRHSVPLAHEGYEVLGIDYSNELLKIAKSKTKLTNIKFLQQDVSSITVNKTFDAAICMWSTFGELPYMTLLDHLPRALNHGGIFVIDTKYFKVIPKGTIHKTYTNTTDNVTITTQIKETYQGVRRISEIIYTINGEVFHDHSEMDILTEPDFTMLITRHGFKHKETYYDYSKNKQNAKRIQLVYSKQS